MIETIESKGKYFYDTISGVFTDIEGYRVITTTNQEKWLTSSKKDVYIGIGDDLRESEKQSESSKYIEDRNTDFFIYIIYQTKATSDELNLEKARWLIREKVEQLLSPLWGINKVYATVQYVDGEYTQKVNIKKVKVNDYFFGQGNNKEKTFEIMRIDGNIIYRVT